MAEQVIREERHYYSGTPLKHEPAPPPFKQPYNPAPRPDLDELFARYHQQIVRSLRGRVRHDQNLLNEAVSYVWARAATFDNLHDEDEHNRAILMMFAQHALARQERSWQTASYRETVSMSAGDKVKVETKADRKATADYGPSMSDLYTDDLYASLRLLTVTERFVLDAKLDGKANLDIARQLKISRHGVDRLYDSAFDKVAAYLRRKHGVPHQELPADLTGQVFGTWTVTEHYGQVKWNVRCRCGETGWRRDVDLRHGRIRRCRTCDKVNHTGKRIGNMEILDFIEVRDGMYFYNVRCHPCGSIKPKIVHEVMSGAMKSCGCAQFAAGRMKM